MHRPKACRLLIQPLFFAKIEPLSWNPGLSVERVTDSSPLIKLHATPFHEAYRLDLQLMQEAGTGLPDHLLVEQQKRIGMGQRKTHLFLTKLKLHNGSFYPSESPLKRAEIAHQFIHYAGAPAVTYIKRTLDTFFDQKELYRLASGYSSLAKYAAESLIPYFNNDSFKPAESKTTILQLASEFIPKAGITAEDKIGKAAENFVMRGLQDLSQNEIFDLTCESKYPCAKFAAEIVTQHLNENTYNPDGSHYHNMLGAMRVMESYTARISFDFEPSCIDSKAVDSYIKRNLGKSSQQELQDFITYGCKEYNNLCLEFLKTAK